MWTTAGEAFTYHFDFTFNGQYVQPDAGSVKLTLRGPNGNPLVGWDHAVQPDPTTTGIDVTIPAEHNALDAGSAFETRWLTVDYLYQGKVCKIPFSYRLTPFLPITATPEGVRHRLGVTERELPTPYIDLTEAYHRLLPTYPEALPAALTGSGLANLAANAAIEIRAALDQMPSLPGRMLQSQSQDNAEFQRMKVDFALLTTTLENQLAFELVTMAAALNGAVTETTLSSLMLTLPTDPITGA